MSIEEVWIETAEIFGSKPLPGGLAITPEPRSGFLEIGNGDDGSDSAMPFTLQNAIHFFVFCEGEARRGIGPGRVESSTNTESE